MAAPARIAAFAGLSAALIALAVALAPASPALAPAQSRAKLATITVSEFEVIAAAGHRKARLERAAEAFIAAFLRYGVGDLPASVAGSLRRLTTASFGEHLLAAAPRQLGGRWVARIVKLETAFLDRGADRALVRALARRADGPEELSFVFVLRGGRWLAARAAE